MDDAMPSVHLLHRLRQRLNIPGLASFEMHAWMCAWMADIGSARGAARRTVPLPPVGNLRALAVLLDDAAARVVVLDHGQSAVRKGFLRVATSMEARPVDLWPARRSKGASDRLRSAWERLVEGCVEDAVHYWCAVGSREEAWVARALAASEQLDARRVGEAVLDVCGDAPSAQKCAAIGPGLLVRPAVQAWFPQGDPFVTLDSNTLEKLVIQLQASEEVALDALNELLKRQEVGTDVAAFILNLGDIDSIVEPEVFARARKMLFAAPEATFSVVLDVLKAHADTRLMLSLLATLADSVPEARAILKAVSDAPASSSDLSRRFLVEQKSPRLTATALAVVPDNRRNDTPRSTAGSQRRGRGAGFARSEAEIEALEFLSASGADPLPTIARAALRRLVDESSVFRYRAYALLERHAEDQDIPRLLRVVSAFDAGPRRLSGLLRAATLTRLRLLTADENGTVARAALAELGRRKRPMSRRKTEHLLRHADPEVRMLALDQLLMTWTEIDPEDFVRHYASAPGMYYYNVICDLDRRAIGLPVS